MIRAIIICFVVYSDGGPTGVKHVLTLASRYRNHVVVSGFSKPTRPRAERAGGQPLGRSTSGFLHLKALEPPYNRPREAPLKIRLRWSRRL